MKRILVAEDESHTRLSLSILLKRAGYGVSCAEDGSQALGALKKAKDSEERFDLLMTDIQMPDMGGLELIRELKRSGIEVPVLVLTGFGDKDTLVDLLREGCEDYIDKPFTESDLLEHIKRTLERDEAKASEREKAAKQMREIERKMEGYRSAFLRSCSSIESAVEAYRQLVGLPVSSAKFPVALKSHAKDRLGGDYCSVHDCPWGCDLVVADVAGHDMGASYHTVLLKSFFDVNCSLGAPGEEFFQVLNRELLKEGSNERMVTALFARINLPEMWLEIVSAAHPYILRFKAGCPTSILRPVSPHSGFPLGIHKQPVFETRRVNLSAGDRIFVYTDGLPNVRSFDPIPGRREKLGDIRLRDFLQRSFENPLDGMVAGTWDAIMSFCRGKPGDDMLLLGIEIPGASTELNR